jgi:hypothetical protein
MGAKAEVKRDSGLETPDLHIWNIEASRFTSAAVLHSPRSYTREIVRFDLPEVHRVATPLNVSSFC